MSQQEHNEIYLLYACDEWKSRNSMRFIGVTNHQNTLYAMAGNEILENRMNYRGQSGKLGLSTLRQDFINDEIDLQSLLEYGYVEEAFLQHVHEHVIANEYTDIYELLHMGDNDFIKCLFDDISMEYSQAETLEDELEQ